ncbi:hypothetical protein Syun_028782 [Stephania yunnanensis]|uniref:Uncharacterized protein n=1 Tax=Stephania yunnanensis TaxID=152371 RepID=A0AAP0E7F5_9MAGN
MCLCWNFITCCVLDKFGIILRSQHASDRPRDTRQPHRFNLLSSILSIKTHRQSKQRNGNENGNGVVVSGAASGAVAPRHISASSAAPTAYDVLKSYGFPAGLLRRDFSISGYDLKYRETITGRISREKLSDLKGVSVKILFFWVNIIEVTRNGGEMSFSVGIASADFPVDNFEDSPTCGCGFDCKSKDEIGGLERLIQSS